MLHNIFYVEQLHQLFMQKLLLALTQEQAEQNERLL
jgi:hypothetical protein